MVQIGKKAPDFKLTADNGKIYSLKDFKGKKIILYFYPKDNTSGCTKEACGFKDNIKIFNSKNVIILGISRDSTESHIKFKEKFNLPFNLLTADSMEILEEYDVWKEKSLYGRKYMGIERSTFMIDETGKITEIFRKVKVNGHIKELIENIDKQ